MKITNVDISRVMANEVVRASQIAERPPVLRDALVVLDDKGKALVGRRIVDTILAVPLGALEQQRVPWKNQTKRDATY